MIEFDGDVCLSGGAAGADALWGHVAAEAGHKVYHWEFVGHKSTVPEHQRVFLTKEQLLEADPALMKANETLKRRWPIFNQYVANLLRRNYYQVRWAGAVYAISTFEKGLVKGGTAWATTMFCDLHEGSSCNCYVFDQVRRRWYVWDGEGFLEHDCPPRPSGIWAGIGTRELNEYGIKAIHNLFTA